VETRDKADAAAQSALEKKARDVVALHLAGLTDIADYFVLASGGSERHVRTISDAVEHDMKEKGIVPLSTEGREEGRWVIIDYGDVVIHVFLESLRELYDLESLWIEAKRYVVE
jgi:ribosome-associated protein